MTRDSRRHIVILAVLMLALRGSAPGQVPDDGGQIVAEEIAVDEAVKGEIKVDKPMPVAPAAGIAIEEPVAEEIPLDAVVPAPAAVTGGVDALAREALGEPRAPAALPPVEAPAGEPLIEAPPVAGKPIVEPPVAEAVRPPIPEPPPGATGDTVEALAAGAIGAGPVDIKKIVPAAPPEEVPVVEEPFRVAAPPPVPGVAAPVAPPAAVAGGEIAIEEPVREVPIEGVPAIAPPAAPAAVPAVPAASPAAAVHPAEAPPAAGAAMEDLPSSIVDMVGAEALRRKAYEMHAYETLDAAQAALKGRRYQEANKLFEEAIATFDKLGRRKQDEERRKQAFEGMGEALYQWALVLYKQKDYEGAKQMGRRSALAGHPRAAGLVADIVYEQEHPTPPPPPRDEPRWKEPEYLAAQKTIADFLKQGREHMLAGEMALARQNFESVLKRDPSNTEAIRLMQKLANNRYDVASEEMDATRREMMADLRKAWNPRDYAAHEDVVGPKIVESGGPRPPGPGQAIIQKMERIKIPDLEFRQANIFDVVQFLQQSSREFDREAKSEEEKGVNIILNLASVGGGAAAPAPAVDDPFAPAAKGPAAPAAGDVPLITFSARNISLLEALKIVCNVANLKWRIEGSVVMIVPLDHPDADIIVRMYDVLPTVEDKLKTLAESLGSTGLRDSASDFGRPLTPTPAAAPGADWKQSFGEMGVKWPQGSSIRYIGAMGKLVVANTPDNLAVFEDILSKLNVVPNQIEIEARFVEVSQTDLNSLGLEWLLTDDWQLAYHGADASLPPDARRRIEMRANAAGKGFTKGNRFLRDDAVLAGESIADDVIQVASALTNPELSVILHALEQKGSTDLLSAPKITTQSGSEATIKVVTEYVYPTDFEVTPITGVGGGGAGTATVVGGVVEPSGFETREVGVILSVLPEVNPDSQMISLTMTPEVVSDPIWKNYGTTYTDEDGNVQQLNMEQPFFFTRTLSTSIAIYNGATVVMGGMITETRTEVEDKVPFLGDIPVLGRLFRSRYEKSDKRNLLVFVTARLVDPAGRPVKRPDLTTAMPSTSGATP